MGLVSKEKMLEKLGQFHPDYMFNIASFRNFIKAQPEVEPRKGKWIYPEDITCPPYCSECKEDGIDYRETDYCPNCGAKMEEEHE